MEEKFEALRTILDEESEWPLEYLFKFILKSGKKEDQQKIRSFFKGNVSLSFRESSKGNYLAVSIKAKMDSADEIIEVYKKAAKIKGLITL